MILSLRTTSYTAAVFVALILGFLLLLGSQQYRSHKEYKQILEQNEKIIFQFATIREHITESLLEDRPQQLTSIISELEQLNAGFSQVLQEPIIPAEYRISFAGQVDFAGIILLLRSIGSGDQAPAKIRQLNQEIRILGERLMLLDRNIADHVKRKLVSFQNVIIGFLAIILFIIIYILLFWHSRIATPLIDLVRQAREAAAGKRKAIAIHKKGGGEVAELAGLFQALLTRQNRTSSETARYNRLLEMVHKVGESVWQAQTRDAVFREACRNILSNSDYVLAWIGVPAENNRVLPVMADGSTTMSRQEQDECLKTLWAAAEDNTAQPDAARLALEQRTPVIRHDILKELPKGPFKNTPFAGGRAECISLPLVHEQQIFGVMNIYTTTENSFTDEETELLQTMCREIVFALFSQAVHEASRTTARLQEARKKVFESSADPILLCRNDGTIIEANPSAEHAFSDGTGTIIGASVHELFGITTPLQPGQFPDITALAPHDSSREITCGGSTYLATVSILQTQDRKDDSLLLIARDISGQKARKVETIKAAKLAALGELSVGVANEINNLTNGLINYSQILSEEIAESMGKDSQSVELLKNVILEGERISQIVQQLLFFNANQSQAKEAVKLNKILEDSLELTKHQFRYDAIDVEVRFPDIVPSVKVNVREMEHVFLNLLSNARYALNERYPGQNPRKRIEIKGEITARNGMQRFKVMCTDFGAGIQPNLAAKVFEPFFSTKPDGIGTGLGLSISRSIVEDNNGTLEIESVPDDHTSIIMELPVAA